MILFHVLISAFYKDEKGANSSRQAEASERQPKQKHAEPRPMGAHVRSVLFWGIENLSGFLLFPNRLAKFQQNFTH